MTDWGGFCPCCEQVGGHAMECPHSEGFVARNLPGECRPFRRRKMSSPDPADPRTPVYEERNRLVALLAALYPSSLERHPDEDEEWEDDWRWIVFIEFPGEGQATWHIHDSQLPMFSHVPRFQGKVWDGHSNEEKYMRVARVIHALSKER